MPKFIKRVNLLLVISALSFNLLPVRASQLSDISNGQYVLLEEPIHEYTEEMRDDDIRNFEKSFFDYMSEFDYDFYYKLDILGQDIKEKLKLMEMSIKQLEIDNLAELNKIIGEIDIQSDQYGKDVVGINSLSSYDYNTLLPTSFGELNSNEVAVFNSNPAWGLVVLSQGSYAMFAESNRFGSNTWGTNGDAFRHSLWNALGAKGTSISYMNAFATAHETGNPNYNPSSIDTYMDLFNNEKGRTLLSQMSFPSNPPNGMTIPYIIVNNIANAVANGNMLRFYVNGIQYTYLMPTNSSTQN